MNTVFTDVPFVTHFLFLWNNQASLTVCWTPTTQQNAKDWSHTHVFVFNWHTHVVQNPPKSARSPTIQKCCKCIINHSEICSLVWDDHMHSLSTIEDSIATFLKAWKNAQFQSLNKPEKNLHHWVLVFNLIAVHEWQFDHCKLKLCLSKFKKSNPLAPVALQAHKQPNTNPWCKLFSFFCVGLLLPYCQSILPLTIHQVKCLHHQSHTDTASQWQCWPLE